MLEFAPITTIKAATAIAGTLGNPSKMPGKSYGLPAAGAAWVPQVCNDIGVPVPASFGCAVGAKLAAIAGTTCAACYATRANYRYGSVQKAQAKRASGVFNPQWVAAMVFLIGKRVDPADQFFRWHDSGDLLGLWHLEKIAMVAAMTPTVQHWLPTREAKVVAAFTARHGAFPANLTVRVSATKIDGAAPSFPHTSTVHKDADAIGRTCPAPSQGNACGDCRACWSQDVANVSYHVH